MFERYTESARRVLFFARYEASQFGAISIGTEHLLLGLTRQAQGVTGRILSRLSLEDLRREIERRTVFHEKLPTSVEIPFSAESKRVLQFAAEEADRLRHGYIGAEHLLLGLLREETSIAGSTLMAQGLRLDAVRSEIVTLLGEQPALSIRTVEALEQVERIKQLVEQLGRTPAGSEARNLVGRIAGELDELKRHFAD